MSQQPKPASAYNSSHRIDGRYQNASPRPPRKLLSSLRLMASALFNKPAGTIPQQPIPVRAITREELSAVPNRSLYRLGHSSVLLKLRDGLWLTDPVFAERASPFSWIGPARFHAPPISLADLPPLRGIVLSHNHYDHLDHQAICQLSHQTDIILAPLGVGQLLTQWGIDPAKIHEFDWWQSTIIDGIQFTACPAQHFSGRGLRDSDRSLWASWAIQDDAVRLFFSGDSGYFDGFKAIGERLGPFDLCMMETGAYDKRWAFVHMQPEQTLQAHLDLGGHWLLPIHNGTFDLAMHPWQEPFERIVALATAQNVAITTPIMGQRIDITSPPAMQPWWRDLL